MQHFERSQKYIRLKNLTVHMIITGWIESIRNGMRAAIRASNERTNLRSAFETRT